MLLTKTEQDRLEKNFEQVKLLAQNRKEELFQVFLQCNEEEELCMKFLYAFMPLSDLANYNGELFLQFVRHALRVREMIPWVKTLDTSIFLNYVLQYRINNENIEFYSESFFEEIYPRIKDKSLTEAVLLVNYWCYEKASYQSSDSRTLSPLSVIRNTYGRCGEESVLLAAALRSVGIPARQCYTPRWAHCDDNHAWVEVCIDGEWNFLGACEPEERLNCGWFVQPASRAMLIHSRIFSPFTWEKTISSHPERLTELNITSHYAKTREIKVQVFHKDGSYAKGVEVRFEIINYAEFFPLACVNTDGFGHASFETGLGDIFIFAHDDRTYCSYKMNVATENFVSLTLGEVYEGIEPKEVTMVPPAGGVKENIPSGEQEHLRILRADNAAAKRKTYEGSFFNKEKAEAYGKDFLKKYGEDSLNSISFVMDNKKALEKVIEVLIHSRGNHKEITTFLEEKETQAYLAYKIALLDSLKPKDLTDVKTEELCDFLLSAIPYREDFKEDIFVAYILCPRVYLEKLTAHRRSLPDCFSVEEIERFRSNPYLLWVYIDNKIRTFEELEYSSLSASPERALSLGAGNSLTKKIAFVSIVRALGIPARMLSSDLTVGYYKDDIWHFVNEQDKVNYSKEAKLTLESNGEDTFIYHKNYSIARFEQGVFKNLEFEEESFAGNEITYDLKPGKYRIMTVNRLLDGSTEGMIYNLTLQEGERKCLKLHLKKNQLLQRNFTIKDRKLYKRLEQETSLLEELKQKSLIAWLDLGKEPTEHLLNELMDAEEVIHKKDVKILVILNKQADISNVTYQKALRILPEIKVYRKAEEDSLEDIYEAYAITDKQMPLALIADEKLTGIFAMAGYHVGIGELLLKHL